ncbi:MAG TPA: 7-carboxy-7-deazaguanine synthase QueE [Salinivirgaceae bacterium]|nr:7-carboxy-7-deazaguanine synthase QueE [Salinivirgaceae bacterium]
MSQEQLIIEGTLLPIVEEFYSIQGEGFHAGKAAYFVRLGGCDIACHFCDTKISWNSSIHPLVSVDEIIRRVLETPAKSVVVTGGEPALYNLTKLTSAIAHHKIEAFLETSGAYPISGFWKWICVSPKPWKIPLIENLFRADELKVVIEQESDFIWAEQMTKHVSQECKLFLQPEFSKFKTIVPHMVEFIKNNPKWNISVQIHKFLDIP